MEKVSIIIPVYNTEKKFLDRCIQSVKNQSYQNIEMVIVDDGSNQETADYLDTFADEHCKIIHQENQGTGTAKKTAFDNATGEYIAYLDSDDALNIDYINQLMTLIKTNDTDMSVVSFTMVDENFNSISNEPINLDAPTEIIDFESFIQRMNTPTELVYVTLWGKLFKRKLFENVEFPIGLFIDDEPLIHQLAFNSNKIAVSYKNLYNYTKMTDSVMNSSEFKEYRLDIIYAYNSRIEFLKQHSTADLVYCTQKKFLIELLTLYIYANNATQDKKSIQAHIKEVFNMVWQDAFKNSYASKKFLLKIKFISFNIKKYDKIPREELLYN